MIDPAIQTFLIERINEKIKKKTDSKMTDHEKKLLFASISEDYKLEKWLPEMLRVADSHYVTHPAKFTHSKAKATPIVFKGNFIADGFLKSGSTKIEIDFSYYANNGESTELYKFLQLKLCDEKTVLEHLENNTQHIQYQFKTMNFDVIRNSLLREKEDVSRYKTSERVKQVYFPVDETYHLLSILSSSGLMFKLKNKILPLRFPDEETKAIKDAHRKNEYAEKSYFTLSGLSEIGFGGDNKQNVSILNNQNGGTAYLLESLPPILKKRSINPPKSNFFSDSLRLKDFQEDFDALHKQLSSDTKNIHVRNKRDWLIKNIIYQVADKLWQIRYLDAGWSSSDRYQNLPQSQKIWLDQTYQDTRQQQTDWQDEIKKDLARWLSNSYKKSQGDKALSIDADEYTPHFVRLIEDCEAALL
jgi:CRISPR-associated protein Csy1